MTLDWLAIRLPPIEAIRHGVAQVDTFETEYLGPRTWERIDYPAAQVYPVNTTRSNSNEFTHTIEANLIFERQKGYDYIEDVLHPLSETVGACMEALANTEEVVAYYPNEIEDFAGDLDGTGVIVIRIAFTVTTLVDFGDTSPNR